MTMRFGAILLCLCLLIPASFASRARATLGEAADSIDRDRRALLAVKRAAVSHGRFSTQEIASDATTVREFITPAGVVFAVAWNGLVHPDLKVLLGSYDLEYRSALRRQPRKQGRRQTQVKSERVIVETWGHMRNLQGRAYLPALVPEGVSLHEIR